MTDEVTTEIDRSVEKVDPNRLLSDWLKANQLTLTVSVVTPKGEHISPENFILPGWNLAISAVVPKNI